MKRKIISTVLAAIAMSTLFIVTVNGYFPSYFDLKTGQYKDTYLATNKMSAETGTVTGTWKYFSGQNEKWPSSKHDVHFISRYKEGSSSTYKKDVSVQIARGSHCPRTTTSTKTNTEWKLELNTNLLYFNCDAYGFIWYNM